LYLPVRAERAKRCLGGAIRDGAEDALDGTAPAEDGAKDAVAGPSLGPGIHLGSVFLIREDDGDELRADEEGRIGLVDDLLSQVSENKAAEGDTLRSAWRRS
jgi:hypothetical protein